MRQGLWLTFILLLLVTLIVISHAQSPRAETVPNAGAVGPPRAAGNLEVLSDTKGVDFNPYLSKLLQKVRANWYNVIPEEARPPQLAAGVTTGRAVVVRFRVEAPGPSSVTGLVVKLHAAPVGRPVHDSAMGKV